MVGGAGEREKEEAEVEMEERAALLWSWGAGTDGQLATGTLEDQHLPQPLPCFPPSQPISRLACGGAHAIALTEDGKVLTWGRGTNGQLGHGKLESCLQPKLVNYLESFTISYVSAGWNHSGFVTDCGRLFMCGDGSFGQLGRGDFGSHCSPIEVLFSPPIHVKQVACGMRHTLALVKDPSGDLIYGFGAARHGQISVTVTIKGHCIPTRIRGFENCDIVSICANGDQSSALAANGQLYIWGRGFSGRSDAHVPRVFPSSLKFSQVALGWNHALLISDDDLYMLGGSHHGMLGGSKSTNQVKQIAILRPCTSSNVHVGEASTSPTLERVPGLDGEKVVCIAAGSEHSALVTEKGSIMTWGWGEHGQLGLGDTCDHTHPQVVNMAWKESNARSQLKSMHLFESSLIISDKKPKDPQPAPCSQTARV